VVRIGGDVGAEVVAAGEAAAGGEAQLLEDEGELQLGGEDGHAGGAGELEGVGGEGEGDPVGGVELDEQGAEDAEAYGTKTTAAAGGGDRGVERRAGVGALEAEHGRGRWGAPRWRNTWVTRLVAEVAELGGGVELERAGGEGVAQAAELGVGEDDRCSGKRELRGRRGSRG
jgi:hypothetical protein